MDLNSQVEHLELAHKNLAESTDSIRQDIKSFENYQKKLLREIKDMDQ